METSTRAKRAARLFLIAVVAVVIATGCSGLTSAGLPATQSHSSNSGNNSGAGTNGGQTGTAQASVSSTNLNFGNVSVGATGTQQVTITNTGTTNVTITEKAVSGAGFAASGIGSGLILAPAQSATLEVNFTPMSAGQATGVVPLVSDAWSAAVAITLSGAGVQPSAHVADLIWDPSSSAVVGYNAYRGTQSGGPYTRLNLVLISDTSYVDTSVAGGQAYFYVVTAVDFLNAESSYSNEVSATIP